MEASTSHPAQGDYPTVYRPEYYQGLLKHHDDVLKKASQALEKQEEHASTIKRAVHNQEVFNYQLRDATAGLFETYEALKKKHTDYQKYISLLERQHQLLTKKVGEAASRRLDRERKTTQEIIEASKKRDEVVEALSESRERFLNMEKKLSEYRELRKELEKEISDKSRKAEKLLEKDKAIADHNVKMRQVLKLEKEAVQLVEMSEHRRLDQLSLIDPVYAEYLKKRWAIDSGRTLYEWELSRFTNLAPPLADPSLSHNESKRHAYDRIKVMDTVESTRTSPKQDSRGSKTDSPLQTS